MKQVENTAGGAVAEKKHDEKQIFQAKSNDRFKLIPVTPYSVFIRSSPVYITSLLTSSTCKQVSARPRRMSSKPCGSRQGRRLPYRPDAYPYADARWNRIRNSERNAIKEDEES